MGTSIEFDRVVVTFEGEDHRTPRYVLVHEVGSDNSFDHDGSIARDWRYYTVGEMEDVIDDIED